MKYHVAIQEVHINHIEVEADSEAQAKDLAEKALISGVDTVWLEYSHTMDKRHWTTEKLP